MKTDQKTLDLIKEVNRQKAEISKAEKPNYATNMTFSFQGDGTQLIPLHVEANIVKLVNIVAFLLDKKRSYNEAAVLLGVEAPAFTWGGFGIEDWIEDIRLRVSKVQIASKKKKLETLEARLNLVISPELRAKMELEAIESELK